jgi:hypothetical protein
MLAILAGYRRKRALKIIQQFCLSRCIAAHKNYCLLETHRRPARIPTASTALVFRS